MSKFITNILGAVVLFFYVTNSDYAPVVYNIDRWLCQKVFLIHENCKCGLCGSYKQSKTIKSFSINWSSYKQIVFKQRLTSAS